ncbi:MAG: hypothetical protein NTX29_01475, partial [Actinobacteria bacterium]|nr:hypothetical protein [Actinomycetota bacterium]
MDIVSERDALIALAHCVEPGDAAAGRLLARHGAAALVGLVVDGHTGLRNGDALAARLAGFDVQTAGERAESCG